MIYSVRLIVLHTLPYTDSSLLVYAYTNLFGRQTYMLRGGKTKKTHRTASQFFPLHVLDAEVTRKNGANIHHIKEFCTCNGLYGMRTDIYKSVIALFLGEVLYKSVKEEEANLPLFHFLVASIYTLNDLEEGVANFHLYFLAQLCTHLGYAPFPNFDVRHTPLFDMAQGVFVPTGTASDHLFSHEDSRLLAKLTALPSAAHAARIPLNGAQRHQFVMQMMRYLRYHLGAPLDMKSPDVLQQIFK